MSSIRFSLRAFLTLVCLCAFASMAQAQFRASIQGTVLDSKGGAVSGARVTLTNQETGATRETVASAEGFYRIAELPPGKYTVSVEAAAFKKFISKDVRVEAEQTRGFDVTLDIGAVTEQVTVTASG